MLLEDYYNATAFIAGGKIPAADKWCEELMAQASARSFGNVG